MANMFAFVFSGISEGTAHVSVRSSLPWLMVGVPLLIAIVAWAAGWALNGFRSGLRLGGIVLLSVVGVGFFMILTLICMHFSPEMKNIFATGNPNIDPFSVFSHPMFGFIFLGGMLVLGLLLMLNPTTRAR